MSTAENINQALRNVRSNLLRTILTLMIIAFGIMALVGILTAIDSAIYSLNDNFSQLGSNSFSIRPQGQEMGTRRGGRSEKAGEPITYRQLQKFQDVYTFPAQIAIDLPATSASTFKYKDRETNPTIQVLGINNAYLDMYGYDLEWGRSFSNNEQQNATQRVVIGKEIVDALFDGVASKAIDQVVMIGNVRYKVIGVFKSKGASLNQNTDKMAFIPFETARRIYGNASSNYGLAVAVFSVEDLDAGISEAIGAMRSVRSLKASQANDFEIGKSDSLISIIKDNTSKLRMAAIAIGLITLLGAAIGLMNIMLVSVTERTREVGICKAIGATRQNIMMQFLMEAIVICQLGGLLGIILGILIGNVVTLIMGGTFLIPWGWMILGITICIFVGILSGIYPALKAARLDPIEALRYE